MKGILKTDHHSNTLSTTRSKRYNWFILIGKALDKKILQRLYKRLQIQNMKHKIINKIRA